ncbi:Chorismate--pyruvate lyase [hydrothermal vent metagenome]|uniref:Chorismate--pyruvate lyase n=1 Tax=hydrothermal vent metagenome TaxID=652676 RepID=A0A3B0WGK0_9ZZZZ
MIGHYSRLHWRNQRACITSAPNIEIKSWLFDGRSLTARLIDRCDGKFSVKVLSVYRGTPFPDEIKALNLTMRSRAIIRQVLLLCDGQPLVYARTIIPISSLRGPLRGVALLGNKSLGAILFADKSMQRLPVEAASVSARHQIHMPLPITEPIWGRRSVFILKQKSVLVSEFFLPELFNSKTS